MAESAQAANRNQVAPRRSSPAGGAPKTIVQRRILNAEKAIPQGPLTHEQRVRYIKNSGGYIDPSWYKGFLASRLAGKVIEMPGLTEEERNFILYIAEMLTQLPSISVASIRQQWDKVKAIMEAPPRIKMLIKRIPTIGQMYALAEKLYNFIIKNQWLVKILVPIMLIPIIIQCMYCTLVFLTMRYIMENPLEAVEFAATAGVQIVMNEDCRNAMVEVSVWIGEGATETTTEYMAETTEWVVEESYNGLVNLLGGGDDDHIDTEGTLNLLEYESNDPFPNSAWNCAFLFLNLGNDFMTRITSN